MKILYSLFILLIPIIGICDSPLTSTDFHLAYKHPIIEKASNRKGKPINKELMHFLMDKGNALDCKVALINAVGWNFEGQKNAQLFMKFLIKNKKCKNETELLASKNAELLICYTYLMAMDNYFHVLRAKQIAQLAVEENKTSYTVHIIAALIEAQEALNTDWCQVYQSTNRVREATGLAMDMDEGAVKIIFEYMDIYSSSCDK
jgi:hypothetical protein